MGRHWLLGLILVVPIGSYCYVRSPGKPYEIPTEPNVVTIMPLTADERASRYVLASVSVMPGQPFPSSLPWQPIHVIGEKRIPSLEDLLPKEPVKFLEGCLAQYKQKVEGYQVTFIKREKIEGKLEAPELVRVHFREKPFSVHMEWLKGERKAWKSLYVVGENDGNLVALPVVFGVKLPPAGAVERSVDSDDAKKSGRYGIHEFGLGLATKRVLDSMHAAQKKNTLNLRYEGITRLKEVGDRPCHKFVRTPYNPPEEDGVNELTIYIDQETLLQVGSVLRDSKKELLAEYYFRDIELNPKFNAKQFKRDGL